jgi:hypothetical protein
MVGYEGTGYTMKRGGGIYDRVNAHERVKEGASIGVAPWRGRRAVWRPWRGGTRGGGGGATGSGEGGRKGKGARSGGPARPAGPLRAKRSDGCWAVWAES